MASSWNGWCCQLGLASLLGMGGAIAALGDYALAQITPDNTLGAESSVVTPTNIDGLPTEQIGGGATRGANLFHSFEQFSIPTGGAAHFNNAADIQNIISRVTGGSVSNIDGLIRANGTANLFLLNPNGIIFGPHASLNIGGSILGTTASAVNFADGTFFSANNPQSPPLLTVSVPVGLQFGGTASSIINQSRATNSSDGIVGLAVQPGKTLALVGSDVRLEGGRLQALGGRIELGGLASPGSIGLTVNGSEGRLNFPDNVQRADVWITNSGSNSARLNVAAGNGGSIAINARNIDISGSSVLRGGLETDSGFLGATAGDITLNATGAIAIANSSSINNLVRTGSVGNGGNINITTGSLAVTDGAQLSASTRGQGNAGSVNINARDTVSFDGIGRFFASVAFSTVEAGAVGNGGDINITTGSLSLTNGAGQGDAGSVNIHVRDTVSFDGVSSDGYISGAYSNVKPGAVGNGGSINITTGSLSVTNDAQLSATSLGKGNAGSVNINTRDTVSFSEGDAFSSVSREGKGNGGSINITTGSLSVSNGAQLNVLTRGQGDAGSVNINARDTVSFDGVSNGGYQSAAFSTVESGAVGNGGGVNIMTLVAFCHQWRSTLC